MKRQKLEAKRKKEAEKALRDAEYQELAKDKAAKRRQELKESESQLAESKQRFKKMREKKEQRIEQVMAFHDGFVRVLSYNQPLQALCDSQYDFVVCVWSPSPRA